MASTLSLSTNTLAVGRARLSGRGGSRALLEQAFDEVALDRLGLGPEEILYVPHLAGPARLRAGATRHFANGLALLLGKIAERAERDPRGASATDRPYRFSSHTAFAAWLIGAVLDKGSAEAMAVVRAATGRSTPQDWWRRDVLGDGRSLVAVLVRLIEGGKAVRWLARLDAVEVGHAAASLARDYGLVFADVVDREVFPRSPDTQPLLAAVRPAVNAAQHDRAVGEAVRAAGNVIAARGEPLAMLPVAARRLLVAAVVLARTPAAPRAALAREIARWIGDERAASSIDMTVITAKAGAAQASPGPGERQRRAEAARGRTTSPGPPPHLRIVAPPGPARALPRSIVVDRVPGKTLADPPAGAETVILAPEPNARLAPQATWSPFADLSGGETLAPLSAPGAAFDTAFGGLAFLVNAFLAMGLYPDFTRPLDPALPVPPLALADRLGLHWFGARYRHDPLRRWIAQRAPQIPLPRRWRAGLEWLDPFSGGRSWHGGSTLWHAAGFPLANRCTAARARRLVRALGTPLASGARGRSMPKTRHDPDWLECLALFLAARFRRAAPDAALTPAALAIPARVVVSDARLDLHFALATLPLALRLAGLDRDPGWLPAEGRDLRFHFA